LCGAEIWTVRKVDEKHVGCFEMCWGRMEKISWADRVENEEVLQKVKVGKKYPAYNKQEEG
jgi:hypothetical protein